MRKSRTLVTAALVAVALLGGRPVAAEELPDTSICRALYGGGEVEAECTLTSVGPVTVVGAYGVATVTLFAIDQTTGTRIVLDYCTADGGGCVAGHRTTGLDVPVGTQLFCHASGINVGASVPRGDDQAQDPKFACGTFTAAYADSAKDHLKI